jgi:hypothetical protein
MPKREISNLDLKVKLFKEYLENGGLEKIPSRGLLEDLENIKVGCDGKVDPETVSSRVNAAMSAILYSHFSPPIYQPEQISEYKSTLQKNSSFVQQNIDTAEQFDRVYEEFKDKKNTLFRGQREAKWRLYCSLHQKWLKDRLFESDNS